MGETIVRTISVIVFFGIWAYAIKKLGLLWGLSVGWIPSVIAALAIQIVFSLLLGI